MTQLTLRVISDKVGLFLNGEPMNKARFLIIFPLIASGVISGCTGMKKPNQASSAPTPATKAMAANAASSAANPTHSPNSICPLPSIFITDPHAQSIALSDLFKMSGTFSLSSIEMYSKTKDTNGSVLTSYSVGASIKTGQNGMRDTKLQNACGQSASSHGYTESLPVIMTFHLPSLRVTEFDLNDTHDIPASNNPTYANLISDSQGDLSLKNAFAAKGPYSTDLGLSDWTAQLPAQPAMTLLADGSIEMRIHWDQKNISTDGYLHFEQH
jgi:hypothetical protein